MPAFRPGLLEDRRCDDGYELPKRPRRSRCRRAGARWASSSSRATRTRRCTPPRPGPDLLRADDRAGDALISHDGLRLARPARRVPRRRVRITVDG